MEQYALRFFETTPNFGISQKDLQELPDSNIRARSMERARLCAHNVALAVKKGITAYACAKRTSSWTYELEKMAGLRNQSKTAQYVVGNVRTGEIFLVSTSPTDTHLLSPTQRPTTLSYRLSHFASYHFVNLFLHLFSARTRIIHIMREKSMTPYEAAKFLVLEDVNFAPTAEYPDNDELTTAKEEPGTVPRRTRQHDDKNDAPVIRPDSPPADEGGHDRADHHGTSTNTDSDDSSSGDTGSSDSSDTSSSDDTGDEDAADDDDLKAAHSRKEDDDREHQRPGEDDSSPPAGKLVIDEDLPPTNPVQSSG